MIDLEDQESFKQKIIPILKAEGQLFKKVAIVLAKQAQGGEFIATVTQDGLETTNVAKKGDFIIQNQTLAQEQYIIPQAQFQERYELYHKKADGFHEYNAVGKILAMEVDQKLLKKLNYPSVFYFMASWGEQMVVKEKDFLVCPLDFSSVYRIARKEFFETYQKLTAN